MVEELKMADYMPSWVQTPIPRGCLVEARFPDETINRVAFDEKGGLLFGRNGQVGSDPLMLFVQLCCFLHVFLIARLGARLRMGCAAGV